jgi:hypothetical protein
MSTTPAEKYEKLIYRLGGTNADLGEMQSIANEILWIGFESAVDYVEHFLDLPEVANNMREFKAEATEAARP